FYSLDPETMPVEPKWLGGMTIAESIKYELVPLYEKDGKIVIASGNVIDDENATKLEEKYGIPLSFVMSQSARIRQLIDRYQVKLHENDTQANGGKRADHLPTTEERISRFQDRYRQHDFLFREFISLT